MQFEELLRYGMENNASDIHVTADSELFLRNNGRLVNTGINITRKQADEYFSLIIKGNGALRTSYDLSGLLNRGYALGEQRFRINVARNMDSKAFAIRILNHKPASYDELSLPSHIREVSSMREGLVLISGITGSGKTTTLSSVISDIIANHNLHIITIEDPVEYVYQQGQSKISQKEYGQDFLDFNLALSNTLRQDPDVIVVGEMRDQETMKIGLTCAETGHLVFSTIHSLGTVRTIQRLVDSFDVSSRKAFLTRMANSLRVIVSQALIKDVSFTRRYLVTETLYVTNDVRRLILEDRFMDIEDMLRRGEVGHSFFEAVAQLPPTAIEYEYLLNL